MNMLPYIVAKGTADAIKNLATGDIILEYLCKTNLITEVLISGSKKVRVREGKSTKQRERCDNRSRGWNDALRIWRKGWMKASSL